MLCKSLKFRSGKSYFSPQNAYSSLENLMNALNNTQNDPALVLFAV